jgi:hypothetical protein
MELHSDPCSVAISVLPTTRPNTAMYPTATDLALIAAAFGRFQTGEERKKNVRAALALWRDCFDEISAWKHLDTKTDREARGDSEEEEPQGPAEVVRSDCGGQLPKAFPAPFDEFLKLVVGGKTKTGRVQRFEKWIRSANRDLRFDSRPRSVKRPSKVDPESVTERWDGSPIQHEGEWTRLACEFRIWWMAELGHVRKQSGGSRRPEASTKTPASK